MKSPVKLKENKKGLGVYASRNINSGEIIEICPIVVTKIDITRYYSDDFSYYPYWWKKKQYAVLFGFGSIYNHSFKPNATYVRDYANKKMVYVSIKNIKKGKEICVNYLGSPFVKKDKDHHLRFKVY